MMGPRFAADAFQKAMKTRKTLLNLIDQGCQDSIAEMKNHWLNARNTAVHGFVVVSPKHDESLEERLENMKTAAVSGIAHGNFNKLGEGTNAEDSRRMVLRYIRKALYFS